MCVGERYLLNVLRAFLPFVCLWILRVYVSDTPLSVQFDAKADAWGSGAFPLRHTSNERVNPVQQRYVAAYVPIPGTNYLGLDWDCSGNSIL